MMDNNRHFSSQPKIIVPSLTWFIRDAQYPSWWNIAPAHAISWVQLLGLAHTCRQATRVDLFFPFFFHGSS